MGFAAIDNDDIEQALEIACGDTIGSEVTSRRTASDRDIARLRGRVKRFLAELPADTSVSELLDVMDE
ncbi:hypothetical protein [Devosia ginsengisoli]|uniref:hypothetical protein n=1 Tax=Devosia ginsengisoli TaxID=400770 RepID=UPI0026E957F0|nr:hypothetical protein [Devosia ginsengisoli]MCR6672162.1 hypothetical protein [Devosia ginsengisoli]